MRVDVRRMQEPPTWAIEDPIKAPFGGGWSFAIEKMEKELWHLDVEQVVIEVTGSKIEIRRDGWLSARSVVDHPVIVSFDSFDLGPLQYHSARYDTYASNVHAVALTLERLRAIDRYGCAPSGQQYTGWAALPETSTGMTPGDAASFLRYVARAGAGDTLDKSLYREALKKAHPDHGGSRQRLEEVQQAGIVLGYRKAES